MDTTGPSAPSTSVSRGPRLGRFSRPPVLLVLVDDELVIAPTKRRNESLPVPLAAIAEVGVTMSRRAGGVTIRLDDGRSAAFLTFPDPELVEQLAQLGFIVENA